MSSWRFKYLTHKGNAKRRGIEFLLSFDEWSKIWHDSGHLHERGQRKDQYVMARYGDVGPYAVDNVKIVTWAENREEQKFGVETRSKMGSARIGNKNKLGYRDSPETRAKKSASLMGNKYTLGKRHTPEECERQRERSLKWWTPERRHERSLAVRGRSLTQEHREKIGKANSGRTMSPEARANMKAGWSRKRKMERRQRILSLIVREMNYPLHQRIAA
jgi:NUMOD3 motif